MGLIISTETKDKFFWSPFMQSVYGRSELSITWFKMSLSIIQQDGYIQNNNWQWCWKKRSMYLKQLFQVFFFFFLTIFFPRTINGKQRDMTVYIKVIVASCSRKKSYICMFPLISTFVKCYHFTQTLVMLYRVYFPL